MTVTANSVASTVLGGLPAILRQELVDAYNRILKNYREYRWEPSSLNGGKLCEIVYSILKGHVDGAFPKKSSKPRNMVDACRALEQADASKFPRSVRIQVPRMLMALYEIRSNRGVGHVGGDVDPNHMDATAVVAMSKWVVAELIRVFHNVSTQEATAVVDSIVDKSIPLIWEVDGRLRVLNPKLTMKEKTLAILYQKNKPVGEDDLVAWIEHSNRSVYRRDVLKKAHKQRLIEYDLTKRTAQISPRGIRYVEERMSFELET